MQTKTAEHGRGKMTLGDAIRWVKSLAHAHVDTNDVRWTKGAFGYEARTNVSPSSAAGSSSEYEGMFKITDTSNYDTDTYQLGIADSWNTAGSLAGYFKINDVIDSIASEAALAIPAAFRNDEAVPIVMGYVVANFDLDGSDNPQFDSFSIKTAAQFTTYTADICHFLLGRVYGIEVTDGSITTTTIYTQQDIFGWIHDTIWSECP
jgi:hypothetical protein